MLGGGTQSKLLCQMTASACNSKVSAGPIEATVYGNIAIQLMATKKIENLYKAREIIKNSNDMNYYEPQNCELWDSEYERFKKVIKSREVIKC